MIAERRREALQVSLGNELRHVSADPPAGRFAIQAGCFRGLLVYSATEPEARQARRASLRSLPEDAPCGRSRVLGSVCEQLFPVARSLGIEHG